MGSWRGLGRAVACSSWVEAKTDFADNEPYWTLCFKLGLIRRKLRALRPLPHCVGSFDSLPAFRGRDSCNPHLATLVPSALSVQALRGWRRERSWRLDKPEDRLCATAQGQRRATPTKSDVFFPAMPPNFHARDPDFTRRLKLQLLRFQLDARCNCTHMPRAL